MYFVGAKNNKVFPREEEEWGGEGGGRGDVTAATGHKERRCRRRVEVRTEREKGKLGRKRMKAKTLNKAATWL